MRPSDRNRRSGVDPKEIVIAFCHRGVGDPHDVTGGLCTAYRLMHGGVGRVTRADVSRAVEEYDRLGADGFFSARGFGPARSYELVIGGSRYLSKAILALSFHGSRVLSGVPE